jgi:drug/metabolite transporter (DMT)-like permease
MTTLAVAGQRNRYLKGALLVSGAGLLWSTTGALMRLAPHLDAWQFLFYRCIGMCAFLLLLSSPRRRSAPFARIAALGPGGAIMALALSVATTSFIFAIHATSVANALFFNSCTPLLSALLGALILKEPITAATAGAIALGLGGLSVMVAGEVDAGYLAGNLAALLSALGFAVCTICVRRGKSTDFDAAILGYSLLCVVAAAAAMIATSKPFLASPHEALVAFISGFGFMGLVWVWLMFGETPLGTTLAGGLIILAAVVAMALAGARQNFPAAA